MDLLEEVGGATGGSRRLLLDELHRRRDLNNPHYSSCSLHQFTSFLKALCLYCDQTTRVAKILDQELTDIQLGQLTHRTVGYRLLPPWNLPDQI
ncbi:hypothetical protein R3I93_010463 [Phoxinus phoxinus]|uniref:Uncharacterized protein n=1 Tax=Phoxinus phoxinus TaxID=58324 RepID=A0AAN9D2F5_9TELE